MAAYRAIEYEFDGNPFFWEADKGSGHSVRCIKGNLPEETKGNE